MATGKRYYWLKLKESFMASDTIDYFMEQPNGANYVVLYQLLCLKTINTGGKLARRIGEKIIPYDIAKIQRDCKWFSANTIRTALELFEAAGLIYKDADGAFVLSGYKDLVGSETDYASQKKNQRQCPDIGVDTVADMSVDTAVDTTVDIGVDNVHTDIDIDIDIRDRDRDRDKILDTRDKEKEIEKKKADAFSLFAGDDSELLAALRDFEKMRKSIKKPMTDRAKKMLVNKLARGFTQDLWILVLEQSINRCWIDIYPLKEQTQQKQGNSVMEDLKQLHEMFGDET